MNRFLGCMVVAVGLTFSLCTYAFASSQKIGYLDVAKVISQSQWGKQISNNLKGDQTQLTSEVKAKQDEFIAARNSYMKKRSIMDAKARSRKEDELRQMALQLQQLMQTSQTKWTQEKKQAMEPLFTQMYQIASQVAKSDRYDMVIDRSALIVTDPRADITSEVISKLDSTPH